MGIFTCQTLLRIISISLLHAMGLQAMNLSQDSMIDPGTLMWYRQPAGQWEDALPVGNGRMGAMVYGLTSEEIIQLTEETY